jgi:aminodeoxyfutalosine synthase
LRSAGADALLGEGSEVFLPAIRRAIWRSAASAGQRADFRKIARAAGLKTPLYVVQRENSAEEQAKELLTLRDAAAPGFAAVSFNPDATTSVSLAVTTGMQEMKQIAIARLALPNVAHIRAYWQMLGGKLIQIALRFGASELDGTELDAGVDAESRRHELAREISAAGREPQAIANVNKVVISV